MLIPLLYAVLAAIIQGVVIVAMRKYQQPFWLLTVPIVVHQFLFLRAYTTAANFTMIWFFTTAITASMAAWLGLQFFGDTLSAAKWAGVVCILFGVGLLRLG